jgi:Protein of unknown function (DUF742)
MSGGVGTGDGGPGGAGRPWSRRYRRPYTVTGGRTHPAHDDLELETLVQAALGASSPSTPLGREQRSIAALCQEVVSVAEISAWLDLPIGVTRVLVGDMALEGLVLLYRPRSAPARSDLALLERVLYGLRNIS